MTKFLTAFAMVMFMFSPLASADSGMGGSVGVDSDKFYRGANVTGGMASTLDLYGWKNGWIAGVSATQGHKDDMLQVYGGYVLNVTDDLSLRGGLIHNDLTALGEAWEEGLIGGSYKGLDVDYYINVDNTDSTYLEVGYTLPFISMIDLELNYGKFDHGDNVVGLTASKDVGDWTLSLMLLEESRHGQFMDNASFGVHYNF